MGFFSRLFGKKKKEKENSEVKVEQSQVIEPEKPSKDNIDSTQKAEMPSVAEGQSKKSSSVSKKKEVEEEITTSQISDIDNSAVTVTAKTACGYFEIKKSKDDRYVFNLYAANKVIIATSQIYSSSTSAVNGANSVVANAEKANIEDQTLKNYTPMPYPKWEIYKDKGDQYRFRLSASNGSCICHSQGYTSKANCKNGIESIIRTVKNADIQKAYITNKSQSK